MKTLFTTAFALLCTLQVSAQFNLEFHTGIGQGQLTELKEYEIAIRSSFPSGATIKSFPKFMFYGASAKWNLNEMQLGAMASFGATEGNVIYSSGTNYQESKLHLSYTAIHIITAKRWSLLDDKLSITLDPRVGFVFGKLQDKRSSNFPDDGIPPAENGETTYNAVNIAVEPTLSAQYRVGLFTASAFAGYHFDFSNDKFQNKTDNSQIIRVGNPVTMNLTGYRVGGSVGIYLDRKKKSEFAPFYVAPGLGLDYGGLGVNGMAMVTEYIGLFAGVGYNSVGLGFNGGARLYVAKSMVRVRPNIFGMYGYNTYVRVSEQREYNRVFYGSSFGAGVDIHLRDDRYIALGVTYPVRDPEVNRYLDYMRGLGYTFDHKLPPVLISLGYRIAVHHNE